MTDDNSDDGTRRPVLSYLCSCGAWVAKERIEQHVTLFCPGAQPWVIRSAKKVNK
jgi:hypothetical protein